MTMTRRTFLVSAASLGAAGGIGALIANGDRAPAFVWRGAALGSEARVSLYTADRDQAQEALAAVAQEIERLESIFSLHRSDSELSRLNEAGRIGAASRDLLDVLRSAMKWRNRDRWCF